VPEYQPRRWRFDRGCGAAALLTRDRFDVFAATLLVFAFVSFTTPPPPPPPLPASLPPAPPPPRRAEKNERVCRSIESSVSDDGCSVSGVFATDDKGDDVMPFFLRGFFGRDRRLSDDGDDDAGGGMRSPSSLLLLSSLLTLRRAALRPCRDRLIREVHRIRR
jgi:hypothetical protein